MPQPKALRRRSKIVFETLHMLTPFDIDGYWRAMCLRWLTVTVLCRLYSPNFRSAQVTKLICISCDINRQIASFSQWFKFVTRKQGGICRGKPGNFPLTGSDLPSHRFVWKLRGNGKGEGREREGWGDHLPYFPPLASTSNTTLHVSNRIKYYEGPNDEQFAAYYWWDTKCCVTFIQSGLVTDSHLVKFIANCVDRMFLSVGRSALYCCLRFDDRGLRLTIYWVAQLKWTYIFVCKIWMDR